MIGDSSSLVHETCDVESGAVPAESAESAEPTGMLRKGQLMAEA
jgi:hypothetical protein